MSWITVPKRPLRIVLLVLVGFLVILALLGWHGAPSNSIKTAIGRQGKFPLSSNISAVEAPHRMPAVETPSFCSLLNISSIAFVTKTGATEAKDKLPPQLATCLSCVPDPLIFSDLDQTLGPYQIYDVLSRFSPEAMRGNPEFDIYYKQKELAIQGREEEIPALGELPILTYDWRTKGKSAAWALDKYKFLHSIERAWDYQPDKDWYVFMEADTYLSLANLVRFLATQDLKKELYFGNAVRMFEHPTLLYFAHGGSGFILSGATVKDFAVTHKGLANQFDSRIRHSWFGDYVVAEALDETLHVKLTDILPMMQGDSVMDFPFGEHSWCKPVITLHHMTPEEFNGVFEYEKSQNFSGFLYRDLYAITFNGLFPSRKDNWENSSDNGKYKIQVTPNDIEELHDESDLHEMEFPDNSFEACEIGCIQEPDCVQFSYHAFENSGDDRDDRCHLSTVFRLGHAIEPSELEPGESVSSGWLNGRIAKWVEEHQDCAD